MSKTNQNKISSSSLTNTSSIPEVVSSHSLPTNVAPLVSSNISGTQATTLPIMTGTTSNSAHDDEFLDWLTQSDNLMSGVAPKQNEPSKKKDIYSNKSNEDLFGSIYRQPQTLATVRMYYKFFYFFFLLIQFIIKKKIIHEPTVEHNDSNIVPQGYFDKKKNIQSDDDSDEDTKMVFKIREKKQNVSNNTNIPVPLLPPPPSSSSKNYKEASDDASSSSSETDNQDEDDPLDIFRSKPIKNKTNQQQQHGKNLITDWDEDETKVQESVCLMFVYMYLLLSCVCYKSIRGWCCFGILHIFFYFSFI
jgi:hypothetical protein